MDSDGRISDAAFIRGWLIYYFVGNDTTLVLVVSLVRALACAALVRGSIPPETTIRKMIIDVPVWGSELRARHFYQVVIELSVVWLQWLGSPLRSH